VVEPQVPDDLLYTNEHMWVRVEDGTALFGMTDRGQRALGQITAVELPEKGDQCQAGDEVGSLESSSTMADICAPISGRILEVNGQLGKNPDLLNHDPYGHGWIAKIQISDPSELDDLLSPEDYGRLADAEG